MKNRVIFRLKRFWEINGKIVDLYEKIKSGEKTSEWRNASRYWFNLLIDYNKMSKSGMIYNPDFNNWDTKLRSINLTKYLKVNRAWFTVGFPKNNLPRLEADITGLVYHPSTAQLEIQFTNVIEISDKPTVNDRKTEIDREILTIGYGGKTPTEFFKELQKLEPCVVVDVRRDPEHAFLGIYTKSHLKKVIPNYVSIPELGNKVKTLPPEYVNKKAGFIKLLTLLQTNKRIVLLCAEKNEENCHRKFIKEELLSILKVYKRGLTINFYKRIIGEK